MADKVHQKTQGLVSDIKSGLHGIHGAGEALRGGAMEALDGVFHKREGEARNREITERGLAEMRGTEERFEERTHHHHHHDEAVGGGGHGFGLGHSQPQGHGQGSHFANAHARDTPAGTDYGSVTEVGSTEGDGMRAARLAMPGPNKQQQQQQ